MASRRMASPSRSSHHRVHSKNKIITNPNNKRLKAEQSKTYQVSRLMESETLMIAHQQTLHKEELMSILESIRGCVHDFKHDDWKFQPTYY
ncbi:hypothetical protein AAMO2058_000391400 [Amorphochlora amoebiformis]